eukprot:CAMPEP_0179085358 /NCGR_PEP_ID=MMETSP0796-20121207/38653_1 /TAXON_ID=73915 /ORGANISM="Pyrodinium bahamense, Strain pbaha01" /LENGTH=103 /DNA_ID=CAMNT_0020782795 /DNA_START=471 /DNA_END=782 /DNA_ORIENTATION=-
MPSKSLSTLDMIRVMALWRKWESTPNNLNISFSSSMSTEPELSLSTMLNTLSMRRLSSSRMLPPPPPAAPPKIREPDLEVPMFDKSVLKETPAWAWEGAALGS